MCLPQLNLQESMWCRSEEHTSELQSRENLVCRLLLEKKNRAPWCDDKLQGEEGRNSSRPKPGEAYLRERIDVQIAMSLRHRPTLRFLWRVGGVRRARR